MPKSHPFLMVAEIHALIEVFDASYVIKGMMEELLGQEVDIDAYMDSQTVLHIVAKKGALRKDAFF